MLRGSHVSLRPIAEGDLQTLHARSLDLEARGPWYPLPSSSLTSYRRDFAENGFWGRDAGTFVVVDHDDRLLGLVVWWKISGSIEDTEVGYRLLDPADRGHGITTEALDLLDGWLFDTSRINRLRAVSHVNNAASHRVLEKCGFTKEATAREAWYHKGRWEDVDVFVMTRAEFEARRARVQ